MAEPKELQPPVEAMKKLSRRGFIGVVGVTTSAVVSSVVMSSSAGKQPHPTPKPRRSSSSISYSTSSSTTTSSSTSCIQW